MRILSLLPMGCALLLASLAGCEDDPSPPEPIAPRIISGQAFCRSLDADSYLLDAVEFSVQAQDGLETLTYVSAQAVATVLPLSELEAVPGGEGCEPETCRAYRWERTPSSEQIYCGQDGQQIWIDIEVADDRDLSGHAYIPTQPR